MSPNDNLSSTVSSLRPGSEEGPNLRGSSLREWVREAWRVLKLLDRWIGALVRRDLHALDRLNSILSEQVERLSAPLSSTLPSSDRAAEAIALARQIRERLDSGYSIIYNELDYTHTLIAMITRATTEGEVACPSWACGNLMDREA